jgi:hypothetical protein
MVKATRARTAETPKQPSLCLRLRAPYLYPDRDLPPRSTLFRYFDLWNYDGTLGRIHYALYAKCRERAEREASPTACIIDSQSVKSAEKGGPVLTRTGLMAASSSRARSGTF